MRQALVTIILSLTLTLTGCGYLAGGDVSFAVTGVDYAPILEARSDDVDEDGVLSFAWTHPTGSNDSPGFQISKDAGDQGAYSMNSSYGAVEDDLGESGWLLVEVSPWTGGGHYSAEGGNAPTVLFSWSEPNEDDFSIRSFLLSTDEGGSCAADIATGGGSGTFTCVGMSAVVDEVLEPGGLLEIEGSWRWKNAPQ